MNLVGSVRRRLAQPCYYRRNHQIFAVGRSGQVWWHRVRRQTQQQQRPRPLSASFSTLDGGPRLETHTARKDRLKRFATNAGPVRSFMLQNYHHFNAASTVDAAAAYSDFIDGGGKMFMTLAGAMSSAQLGISLSKMIRAEKISAICCTGANLEEDIFNLVAHNSYARVPGWRHLSEQDEVDLYDSGRNRVTDTCIPEEEAFRVVGKHLLDIYQNAEKEGKRLMPYEVFFQLLRSKVLEESYEIDPKDSWVMAAAEANIPVYCPGWEDSTSGNIIVAEKIRGNIQDFPIKSGLEQMEHLVDWYIQMQEENDVGFFQIGGGIAGDYPICAVPLIRQDLEKQDTKYWKYFCQISEAVTSYGGYSGAPPNEKITWGKMTAGTPQFVIESDATIVYPLVAGFVLNE